MRLLLFINAQTKCVFFDTIIPTITHLGEVGLIWIIISLILLFDKKYRYAGFLCLCSLALTGLVGEIFLKHLIARPRPFLTFEGIELLVSAPRTFSFPSGHTTASFAAAYMLACKLKPYGAYFFLLAILMAFSRLYLLVHYPLDVLAGALLGILCAKAIQLIFPLRIPRQTPRL